jgi:hypothetical protein
MQCVSGRGRVVKIFENLSDQFSRHFRLFYALFLFFGDLNPHAKFQNPRITSSGRKVMAQKRKREKSSFIVDT